MLIYCERDRDTTVYTWVRERANITCRMLISNPLDSDLMLLFVLLPSITRNTFRWMLCQKLLHTRCRLRDCTHQKCMHESYSNSNDSNSFKSVHIFHTKDPITHTQIVNVLSRPISNSMRNPKTMPYSHRTPSL